ncbi:MAG: hypothetical protein PHH85_02160 [Candidatus Methanoperedens sp.]|nr:hypothetical protein [Candidatus Methanoperedens sp.]
MPRLNSGLVQRNQAAVNRRTRWRTNGVPALQGCVGLRVRARKALHEHNARQERELGAILMPDKG